MKCGARSLSTIVLLVTLSSSQLSAQSTSGPPPNIAGLELLGRGLVYSFNYERLLTHRIGVGGGLAYWSISSSGLFAPSSKSTTFVIPAYLSWTPIGRNHSPYLAAGVTMATSKATEVLLGNTRNRFGAFSTLTLGYQYRSGRGIVVRPTVSRIAIDGDNALWPGITLGYAF